MTKVFKRDGREVDFDKKKIKNAILKAMTQGSNIVKEKIADDIANEIANEMSNLNFERKYRIHDSDDEIEWGKSRVQLNTIL